MGISIAKRRRRVLGVAWLPLACPSEMYATLGARWCHAIRSTTNCEVIPVHWRNPVRESLWMVFCFGSLVDGIGR